MKKFLLTQLIPFLKQVIQPIIYFDKDDVGFFVKLELHVFNERIINRKIYLAQTSSGGIKTKQRIKL